VTSLKTSMFRALHDDGLFLMPNPWDVGSARYLEWRGLPAVATTSSGHAATLGLLDQQVGRDQLVAHVEAIANAVSIPLNVDTERCFADDPAGVAETVALMAAAGAAGCSIEDYDPATGTIDTIDTATERVGAAAEEAGRHGLVLTARAENHLYGIADLADTIDRLIAYQRAGADVVYAPGLNQADDIGRVVDEVGAPVNVLALPGGPSIDELRSLGVRRVSTGGALTWAAFGALARAVDELVGSGTSTYTSSSLPSADRNAALGHRT
jgi:2-methylisocitrate lyase-like PEP mutase family enzyme